MRHRLIGNPVVFLSRMDDTISWQAIRFEIVLIKTYDTVVEKNMDILGVGPLEFVLILVLMLILLGPKGMVKMVHDVGQFLKNMVQSPIWKSIVSSSQEIRQVQTQIIKESGLDESLKEIRASTRSINKATTDLIKPALDVARVEPVAMDVPKSPIETKPVVEPAMDQSAPLSSDNEPGLVEQPPTPAENPATPPQTTPSE